VRVERAERSQRREHRPAVRRPVIERGDDELGGAARLADPVALGSLHRVGVLGAERQRDEHVAPRAEVTALDAVERDHRQRRERGRAPHLGLAHEPAQDDEIGILGRLGAGQAGEPQLAVELHAVLMAAGDDERPESGGAHVGGDPRGDLGVARDHPEHGPVVPRGVVAPGLVVVRDAGPGRHRRQERQPRRRARLDRLGHVRRAERPEQRERARVRGRGLGGRDRVAVAMRDVRHAGRPEDRARGVRERLGQRRVHGGVAHQTSLAAARAATSTGS
jgi:hypothetical protein